MSLSNKKYLISGCGISWSGQERKTWVNICKASGAKVVDVGGPAVSNQWILNKVITELNSNMFDCVIIQLTSLLKLDVEINQERYNELVATDSVRNFTYQGIWPSSASTDHISKQMNYKWLASPILELEDIFCKLILLDHFCKQKGIKLYVFQGYELPWTPEQKNNLIDIIQNLDKDFYSDYLNSAHYQFHDHSNSVPCLSYQFYLARQIAQQCFPILLDKIEHILAKHPGDVLK
jgi:hypothetical protein